MYRSLITFVFSVCVFFGVHAAAQDTVKIGFTPSLTGSEAGEAKALTNAITLATKQINASGGIQGKKIQIVTEDAKSNPQGKLAAYEKLLDEHKVAAVVAGFKSAQIVALAPKMQASGVPTFIGGTNPRLTDAGLWFFRTRPDDTIAAEAMVRYLKDNTKFTKIGVIHDAGAFGQGGANLVDKHSADLGLKVVKRVSVNFGETSFSKPLQEIKAAGAEALIVYVANLDESAGIQLEHAKIGKPFFYLGSPASQAKRTLDLAKDASQGVHAIVDFAFGQSEEDKKYAAEYKAEFKEEPDSQSAYVYDAMMIYAKAAREVGADPSKVRDAIFKMKGHRGVMGAYNFAPKGNGLSAVSIVRVDNGERKLLKVVSVAGSQK